MLHEIDKEKKKRKKERIMLALLLLWNDNSPLVLLVAIHDVLEPLLQLESVLATLAVFAHGN